MKTLDEYKAEKENLEKDILEKLTSFQKDFKCIVDGIDLVTIVTAEDIAPKKIIRVALQVRI